MDFDNRIDYNSRSMGDIFANRSASNSPPQSFSDSHFHFLDPNAPEFNAGPSDSPATVYSSPEDITQTRSMAYDVQPPQDQVRGIFPEYFEDSYGASAFHSYSGTNDSAPSFDMYSDPRGGRGSQGFPDRQGYHVDYSLPLSPRGPPQYRQPPQQQKLPRSASFRSGHQPHQGRELPYSRSMAFSHDPSLSARSSDPFAMSAPFSFSPSRSSAPNSMGGWSAAHQQQQSHGGGMGMNSSSKPAQAKRVAEPIDGFIYQVQFKRAHRNFVMAPSAPRDIIPGDFVKVEADRGEDMGIVLAKIPVQSFEEVIPTAGYRGRGFSSGQGERKYLYRRATVEERNALQAKVADEERALQTVQEKAAERGLPMQVLDAEYQFDRHKLIFYFEADKRIDFRDLVSELFSQYKTRIWMQQVDMSTLPIHDVGTDLARATGFLPNREDDITVVRRSHSFGSASSASSLETLPKFDNLVTDSNPVTPTFASSLMESKGVTQKGFNSMILQDPWGSYHF